MIAAFSRSNIPKRPISLDSVKLALGRRFFIIAIASFSILSLTGLKTEQRATDSISRAPISSAIFVS